MVSFVKVEIEKSIIFGGRPRPGWITIRARRENVCLLLQNVR